MKAKLSQLLKLDGMTITKSIISDYSLIIAGLYIGTKTNDGTIKILMGFIIARQMHALAILFHDAAHYNVSRNRHVNDFIGDWILGAMQFFSIKSYRVLHNKHHSHVLTEKDPDFRLYNDYPMKLKNFVLRRLFKDLLGLSWLKIVTYFNLPADRTKMILRKFYIHPLALLRGTIWIAGVSAFVMAFGQPTDIIYLWLLPLFAYLPVMLRVRAVIEHGGLTHHHHGPKEDERKLTRTTPGFLMRLLICPHHIGYHAEHHLHPAVPYYNLPELSRELRKSEEGQVLSEPYNFNEVVREIFTDFENVGAQESTRKAS